MSTNGGYSVFIEKFVDRHFIRNFAKKYKGKQWDITMVAIREILSRFDNIAPNNISADSKLDIICPCHNYLLIKLDFKIAGSNVSAKSSGNRVIAAVDTANKVVKILIIYSKNDVGPPNETAKWKKMVAENYFEFKDLR
jgi:hypothetical protein